MQTDKKRIVYIDILRIIASIAVVVIHTAADKWYSTSIKEFDWQVYNFFNSITRWGVAVFIMVSGVFFLDPEKNISTKTMYSKYIVRIIIVIFVWGLFYQAFGIAGNYYVKHEPVTFRKILFAFITIFIGEPWGHLWYLYMLLTLYIMTPVYRIFTKNAKETDLRYLLIIFFIFGLSLPVLRKIVLHFDNSFKINQLFSMLIGYSGFYFAGYYFSKYSVSRKIKMSIGIIGILSLLITIAGTYYIAIMCGEQKEVLYDNLLPTNMFVAFAVFLFVQKITPAEISEKNYLIVTEIAKCTFGIYLIHYCILSVLVNLWPEQIRLNPLVKIPLFTLIVYLLSFGIIHYLRKIPFSKYFM